MQNGFTLIEILLTFGLLALVMSFSLLESTSSLQHQFESSESSHFVILAVAARGASLRHICKSPLCTAPAVHGVFVDQSTMTLFEGAMYSVRDTSLDWVLPHTALLASSSLGTVTYGTNGSSSSSTSF